MARESRTPLGASAPGAAHGLNDRATDPLFVPHIEEIIPAGADRLSATG